MVVKVIKQVWEYRTLTETVHRLYTRLKEPEKRDLVLGLAVISGSDLARQEEDTYGIGYQCCSITGKQREAGLIADQALFYAQDGPQLEQARQQFLQEVEQSRERKSPKEPWDRIGGIIRSLLGSQLSSLNGVCQLGSEIGKYFHENPGNQSQYQRFLDNIRSRVIGDGEYQRSVCIRLQDEETDLRRRMISLFKRDVR